MSKLIEMVGKGGKRMVPEEDVQRYIDRKGFSVVGEQEPPSVPDEDPKDPENDEEPIASKINKMTNSKLKAFVKDKELNINLDEFSNLAERKAAVIAILGN